MKLKKIKANTKYNKIVLSSRKSLFKKYFFNSILLSLISFLILGAMLLFLFSGYWKNEEGAILNKSATNISDITAQTIYKHNNTFSIINSSTIQLFLDTFASNNDIGIIITDLDGNIVMSSRNIYDSENTLTSIPSDIVNYALYNKNYFTDSNFGGMTSDNYYIAGVPLFYTDYGVNTPIGTVLTLCNTSGVSNLVFKILDVFLISALVALIWAFIASWISSSKMTKPLKDMSDVVTKFGDGDFSARTKVYSNDEIGQLAQTFNEMADSLENFESVRRSFVSNLSHELRTPMTTISGFIDGILDGTVPQERQSYYLQIVSDEIKRLSRLVKSMRNLSKLDNEEISVNKVKFNIKDSILNIITMFNSVLEEKDIQIQGLDDINDNTILYADYDMIFQVIYNLFENATKFTNKNGYIKFGIKQKDDSMSIMIKNSGIGVPYKDMPMIFDKFYKVDKSRSLDVKGMGLGLYITKTIVELHNGTISVQSIPNEYCEFDMELPNDIISKLDI